MLILVTYDVKTDTEAGKRRLRKVSKYCLKYGQRVQNSVYECNLDAAQYRKVLNELEKLIDKTEDSLRFYNLGTNYHSKVVHIGAKESYDAEGILII